MDLVINEWFPEYCKVETVTEDKKLLKAFLERFLNRKDVLYIKRPSAFLNKVYSYSKEYQGHRDPYTNGILSFFFKEIYVNSDRCVIVDEDCILEESVKQKLAEGNYASDTYLFEAASKTESKIIVTTDDKLCKQMKDVAAYNVVSLKDFLKDY